MSQIKRILHVKDPLYISPIDYVQSSNIIPIVFELVGMDLTPQMTAAVLVIRPDRTFEFDPATLDVLENTITVQPTSTMFAVYGGHYLQVRIYNGSEDLQIAFEVLVRVAPDRSALASIGMNVIPFVDRAMIAEVNAANSAAAAEESAEAAAASEAAAAESELNAAAYATSAANSAAAAAESEANAASSESNASDSASTAEDAADQAATLVQELLDNTDIVEILRNADDLLDRIESLHTLELESTITLALASWNIPNLTQNATLTGATTSTKIKSIALVSGNLTDYLKIVSADIPASATITFTARELPSANITVQVTYI